MIIGGGFGQLPAILIAKSIGLKTIVADKNNYAIGMQYGDIALHIDILDTSNIISAALEYNIAGVMTMQSDIGVPTVGAVVDALGLSGCGRVVSERCSNKILTRELFARHGVPQPNFYVINSLDDIAYATKLLGYPFVVKAPDSSGSRGVVKVNNETELEAAFAEAKGVTRGDNILFEEYIVGIEVGAQAFSTKGRCQVVLVHDDELSSPPFMIPIAHAFPSSLPPLILEKVVNAVSACVEALGISDGPSNVDLIIDLEGNPRIIEVGARIGATCLPELVNYHTGIEWTRAAVQAAVGMDPDLAIKRNQPCAAFILESPEDGIMNNFTLPELWAKNPNVLEWEVTSRPGDIVSRFRKGTDRIGKVLTTGETTKQALELGRAFREAINFQVLPSNKKEIKP